MKRKNPVFLFAVMAFLLFSAAEIDAQVTVILKQPPPYQFKLENLWKVTLINPTNIKYKVYLTGRASESAHGEIMNATSAVFNLSPGTKIVNTYELVPMHVDAVNSKYSDVVKNIGTLPSGDYEICVAVINAETGLQMGEQCIDTQVRNLSEVELLGPEDKTRFISGGVVNNDIENEEDAKIVTGQFITFTWLPPSPVPQGNRITYSIRIAEILGNQTAYDAINSNPAFYIKQNINSTIFLYPAEGRNFNTGRKYAWKVEAYLNNVLMSESQVWEFKFEHNTKSNYLLSKTAKAEEQSYNSSKLKANKILVASADESQVLRLLRDSENNNGPKPISFSGSAKLSYDGGYKSLPFSEIPSNTFTAEVSPTLSIYGLPFTASLLYSTQQGSDRQSLNSFAFDFDIDKYKDQIKEKLEKKADETLSGWEKTLLGVDAFGIGTNYPFYSKYTLNGVPVTGINLEINPGIFYAAFAASKNQQGIDNKAYQRSLYAGRVGIGKKEGTHFFLTTLYARDDENSITVSPDNKILTPQANYILGAETKIAMFDDHFYLEGEGNASVLTRDTRDAGLEINGMPNLIKGMITPKISTSFDYSYTGKVSFNNQASATKVSVSMKMVGPGYTSLGAPDIRNDQLAYEAKFDQGFISRRISVGAFFKTLHDNLIQWKSSTTTLSSYGINLGLNFPNLPFVQLSYSPYIQKNDDTNTLRKVDNRTTTLSAVAGYFLLVDQFNFTTNAAYTDNEAKTLGGLSDYKTNTFSITEAVGNNSPVSFAGTWGLIKTTMPLLQMQSAGSPMSSQPANINSTINTWDLSLSAVYPETLSSTLGFNIASETTLNKKTGIYFNTSYTLIQNINLNARIESDSFKDYSDSTLNYNEVIFSLFIHINW